MLCVCVLCMCECVYFLCVCVLYIFKHVCVREKEERDKEIGKEGGRVGVLCL